MRAARLSTIVALLLVVPVVSGAFAKNPSAPAGPKGLKGFLLRPDEPVTHSFSRTPAFAWQPTHAARCYEFELATSRTFDGNSIIWSNAGEGPKAGKLCRAVRLVDVTAQQQTSGDVAESQAQSGTVPAIRIPAVAINLTLPWFTGKPYALYARVRAITTQGATKWSSLYGFNMRWEDTPVPTSAKPGLVRWRPVDGATSYQVWFTDLRKTIGTHTNVADLREFYTLHSDANWWSTVRWRVRAVRHVLGGIPNGLPAVSYGPWSPEYATTNPAMATTKLQLRSAVSDVVSTNWKDGAHQLMPALTFSGTEYPGYLPLYRVYAFTDRDCVNVVFRGSVTGAPAFAPRISGPLSLPTTDEELDAATVGVLDDAKNEKAKTYSFDGFELTSNESQPEGGESQQAAPVRVDLPDVDAQTTRYFWTVVHVGLDLDKNGNFIYTDLELPQDVCDAGRVATFAKLSKPAITASGGAYVAGLTPKGRLLTSAGPHPVVYSSPLVSWRPVVAATMYEIEWSRTVYPWRRAGHRLTLNTSTVLNLSPGRWYYRVRGWNSAQVGNNVMTWSKPVAIKVARPTFRVSR